MRKEKLLSKKKDIVNDMPYYARALMTEEVIKNFSPAQLKMMTAIIVEVFEAKEKSNPFYTLSATEVLQKSSGRIAMFDNENVIEESYQECMQGASCNVLRNYKEVCR